MVQTLGRPDILLKHLETEVIEDGEKTLFVNLVNFPSGG